jgi:hypothetical protein
MSPLDMLEHGIARAGRLQILDRPDLAFDFLEVCWTSIQHYGVEIGTLRYNGPVLGGLRNRRSPYGGLHAGRWPVAVDPGDITRVWFQDPDDHRWHPLVWEHAAELGRPLSDEALVYARRLAAATHRFPDTKRALVELLERWDAGLTANPAERRMAARLSAQRLRLIGEDRPGTQDSGVEEEPVSALPSVARIAAMSTREEHRRSPGPGGKGSVAETTSLDGLEVGELGGDDEDDDCDAAFPGEHGDGEPSDEDFYTDVLESS